MFSKIKNLFYVKDRINFNITTTVIDEKQGVCVTGKLSVPRKEFEEFLNNNGYELMSSVSKNTKILITDNPCFFACISFHLSILSDSSGVIFPIVLFC